jgi:copper(I)-binding protein
MGRMTRHRIEIGLALAITLAAFLFVTLAVWAQQGTSVAVSEAWARPTIGEGRVTAVYMTIQNLGTDTDVLRSASSPKASRVEIHETKMTDQGVMKMRPVENGLTVQPGGAVSMKPGGLHIMIMGLDGKLPEGATLPLTLDFAKAGMVQLSVPVATRPAGASKDASGDHSHH